MPTALELSREEWTRYMTAVDEPVRKLTAPEQQAMEGLLQRVKIAAAELKRIYGVRRVILFGSLARREWFMGNSDVDLAVEGIGEHYWQAWGLVEDIIKTREVDFVDLEEASTSLRLSIERYGVDL